MGRPGRRGTGRLPWRQPSQLLAPVLLLALLLALLPGCSDDDAAPPPDPPATASACGPVSAACEGLRLPTEDGFVPQGVVVHGRTAWVGGGDADTRPRTCVVLRVDLSTGRVRDRAEPAGCAHGGGLAADRHGLWLADTARLLLLDPRTLEVRRTWRLAEPLRGSFATTDGAGRLGIGGWRPHRRGTLHWVSTDRIVGGSADVVTAADAVAAERTPPRAQGAVVLDGRTWFARSVTRCGVLVAPSGRRRAFVPGAEGMALAGDTLWVVSESGSAYVQAKGGRPDVPTLVRLGVAQVRDAPAPDCRA